MKESVWGYMVIIMGILSITVVYFVQNITNTEENNYTALREVTEAAMSESVDMATYRKTGEIRIVQEKFLENFLIRFAQTASLAHTYKVDVYDINESPPKVSIKLSTSDDKANLSDTTGEIITFTTTDKVDAIIESKD